MTERYTERFIARWMDMDFNQHMRNGAFLGASEDTRMRFLATHGWTMERFVEARIGPVVVEDRLVYKHEIRLLEEFRVDLEIAAITPDARRMKVRNRFFRDVQGDRDTPCAIVESVVLWFDLAARKPIAPPDALRDAWLGAARSDDFESWPGR